MQEEEVTRFGLIDDWQQIDITHAFSPPAHIWTFPLETVSQSEGGFESVYQASVVLARWAVDLASAEPWTLTLDIDV